MKHFRVTVNLCTPEDLKLDGPQQFLAEVDEKEFRQARPGGGEKQITDFLNEIAWTFLFERGRIPSGLIAGLRTERIVVSEEQEPDWKLGKLEPEVAKDGVKLLYLPRLV